ncbi:MAG: transcription antitermination factor NusB, partial [Oscillospiraceae bacterium]|nr:transcription antitermination factor NusB [Oscillospiraceae bacterium]
ALAVMRCAVCEMLYFDDIPPSVTINEAVEIAKSFDSPETVSFINGLLGSVNKALSKG